MAVFHQSDPVDGKRKMSPIWIIVIVVVVVLCCCCAVAAIVYVASKGHPLGIGKSNTFLPLYLTLRTWL